LFGGICGFTWLERKRARIVTYVEVRSLGLHVRAKCIAAIAKLCLGTVNWGVLKVSDLACLGGCFWQFIFREDSFV